MAQRAKIQRRTFLSSLATGGLVLAVGPSGIKHLEAAPRLSKLKADPFAPSVYLSIADTGLITVICHRSEMGQGSSTTLVMTLADELEADWTKIRYEQAIGDAKYGDQNTDGSSSIRGGVYEKFRTAGAAARAMLEQAAAAQWGVPVAEVAARNSAVRHAKTGRTLGYGALVARARALPVPTAPPLKQPKDFRFIGKRVKPIQQRVMVTGKGVYGQDVTLAGMKVAVIARPPVLGSKLVKVDSAAALLSPGVERIIDIPAGPDVAYGFAPLGGVAVIAKDTWSAIAGRNKLVIEWSQSPHGAYDSTAYRAEIEASARAPGNVVRDLGNAALELEAVKPQVVKLQAEYYAAHLTQAPMEPPAALANVTGNKCEIWSCSQDPQAVQAIVAATLNIPRENVTANVTLLGGGFGRKSKPDYVAEAAWLSQQIGAPVKVVWTREDDLHNGFIHTVSAQRLEGAIDAAGKISAWRHRIASPSIFSTFAPNNDFHSDDELALGVTDMPYAIPNVRVETCKAPAHARIGWYRSVSNIPHAFAICSFMDELAHAAGVDPLAFLLKSLPEGVIDMSKEGYPKTPGNYGAKWEDHPNDARRHRKVLETVAREAGWGKKLPAGEGLGIAVHRSFLTYVACVVHAKVSAAGTLTIPRVDMAFDCGFAVNPDRVRAQCEGGIGMALSNALTSELTYEKGAAVQGNFNTYQVQRMRDYPKVLRIHLVDAGGPIGGVGEPPVPPVAPALCNAIFAARGKRIRALPIGRQLAQG